MVSAKALDQTPDLNDLFGIESDCRFVQYQDLRVVNKGLRYSHSLAIPLREMLDQPAPFFQQPGALFHIADSAPNLRAFDSFDSGYES